MTPRPSTPRVTARSLPPIAAACLALPAAACGAGEGAATAAEAGARARHAILVSIDTLRPDHLGCYGHARGTSPNLDRLAARGARFTDVTAAAPWTLPSHASLLSGLYPSHHGVKSHRTSLPDSVVTVAEEFQESGFETFAVVNTHNVGAPQYRLGQGFQRFQYVSETDEDARTMKVRTLNMGEIVVATAKELLSRRDASKPFFLFLHFYDVHTDFTPREEFRARLVGPYEGKLDGRTQQLNGVRNRGERLGEDDLRFLREMYDAEIATFDALFGRFLDWLAEQGLLEDVLFVVTSDHGEEFQEHGSVLHGRTQYQELLEVPLILAGRGVPAGAVIDVPAHGVDVAPTLLALMGIETRARHDGLDLSRLWRGGTLPARLLFGEADQDNRASDLVDQKRMVRRGTQKLIQDRKAQRTELYDLAHDPLEQHDLAGERAELVRELEAELEAFLAGSVASQVIAPPTAEDLRKLEAMGYAGGGDEK